MDLPLVRFRLNYRRHETQTLDSIKANISAPSLKRVNKPQSAVGAARLADFSRGSNIDFYYLSAIHGANA
jgi:hypothetical protein